MNYHFLLALDQSQSLLLVLAILYLNSEMTQKYVQLMEDLQYSRRQSQNWKQKHSILQQQLNASRHQNQQFKKTLERLQETNSRLVEVNRQLTAEKQSIITDYSEEVSSIKEQIAKKQRQILQLKQSTSPSLLNHQLAIRQLKFELTDKFQKQSAYYQKKVQELTAQLDKNSYQKEIQKEKATLKIKYLENTIRQLQQKHEQQITSYSTRLFQMGQVKPPEERELLRRTKRENEELKKRLDLATSDLSSVLDEKNQVHKDYSKWMNEHQKLITDHQNEILAYKAEIARVTALMEENSSKRDQSAVKDRDRDIKRLKGEAEQLRDQLLFKQQKISDLQVQKAKMQAEIKSIRSQQQRQLSKVQEVSQWERDRLQKQIIQARHTLQRIKGQNLQLSDRIYEASRTTSEQRKKFENLQKQEQEQKNKLKRQLSEQNLHPHSALHEQRASPPPINLPPQSSSPVKQSQIDIKQLEEAVRAEKGKLREFLTKYIDLKKKYESCERKLKKANQKIMELLQTKIILGSPKANPQKHFQFPTEPRTQINVSPPPRNEINIPNKLGESRNQVLSSMNMQSSVTTANFKQARGNSNSKTNPMIFSSKSIPQGKLHIRIQDEEGEASQHSYYQKSMKLKTQQFKELKCTNHQHD